MPEAAMELFVTAQVAQAVAALDKLKAANMATWSAVTRMAELASVAIVGMGGAIWVATSMVSDWQKSLVNAAAIGGLTTDQMWKLADASTEAGKAIGVASAEIAEGYLELTRAGFNDMNEIMDMNNVIMQAAVANQISYAAAADTVIKSVKAFSISTEDAYEKVAVLQYIANQTQAEFGDFNSAMAYAGATSYFSGLQFEELAASMGVLTDIAMEAGIGARGLNMMMLDMVSDIPKMQSFLEDFGITVQVVSEDGRLNMTELIKAFGQLDVTMEVLQASAQQFNVRAMRAWLGLISHSERYQELLAGTADASSYFAETYAKQLMTIDNLLGMIRETFLDIFRNKEVVESLMLFFVYLRDALAGGMMEKMATLFKTFMEGAIANAPLIINLMEVALQAINEISPGLILIARVMMSLNGIFLKTYLIFMVMGPLWESFTAQLAAQQVLLPQVVASKRRLTVATSMYNMALIGTVDATSMANMKMEVMSARSQLLMFRIQGVTMAIGGMVSAIMGAVFAYSMLADASTTTGKIMGFMMLVLAALNAFMAIHTVMTIMAKNAHLGWGAIAMGGVAAVSIVGLGAYLGYQMRKQQQAEMEAQQAESQRAMAEWQTSAGVPTAQKGMWKTREGLIYVHDDEMILPPGPARAVRGGGGVSGGGGRSGINVYVSGNVYADNLGEILVEAMNEDYRRYAARRGDY